ncbi:hypothetical protein EDB92DRAFT_1815433 [Lactarius akahatsu]|uniref:Uncharacterized protein n=1 Tax=Lactarius akahatsu TaxID=416441 RepID=A0AAD4LMF6_9AGAM|nr:hypothetical protein EDB92DRAFT_1815433 [Lactarius akahatsu]
MDMITQSITAFLQPHTSSPSMPLVACVMSCLMTGGFSREDFDSVFNAQLNSLAISPHSKQSIIPALLSIAKLVKVQSQGAPKPAPKPMDTNIEASYQIHQRSFSSNSGSIPFQVGCPWIATPGLSLCHHPLTTLGRPLLPSSQSCSGCAHCWVDIIVASPAAYSGQICQVGEEEGRVGQEWQAFSSCRFHPPDSPHRQAGGPWSIAPCLFLCYHPLMTLGHPPPTAVVESQRGELRLDAFGTGAHIAGLISLWPVLLLWATVSTRHLVMVNPDLAPSVGLEKRKAGRTGVASCLSLSPGYGVMLDILSLSSLRLEAPGVLSMSHPPLPSDDLRLPPSYCRRGVAVGCQACGKVGSEQPVACFPSQGFLTLGYMIFSAPFINVHT